MPRPIHPHALRLLALLRTPDFPRAQALLQKAIDTHSPEWTYLRLLMPAVHIAGELFVNGTLDGPTCDRVTNDLFSLMEITRRQLPRQPRLHKKLFATHLPGFVHSVGFTAICHWLDRDGWDITRPLPVPPLEDLAAQILAATPDLLAISCSLPKHILHARRLITALRSRHFPAPIWIGGLPLNANPNLFPRSGADHTAPDILSFTRTLAKECTYETATPPKLT